ncbi:ATP-binding protein [Paenibacillus yanchengensis]|uniref:histidine kinase n=1 Tax=Paenibacillus yanchengensis TaxID=2035833 RepID=A0ABW4YGH3_9BACL
MKQHDLKRMLTTLGIVFFVFCYFYWGSYVLQSPSIGISLALNDRGDLVVAALDPYGQASNKGMRVGDIVIRINDEQAHLYLSHDLLSRKLFELENINIANSYNPETYQFTTYNFATSWAEQQPMNVLFMQLYLPMLAFIFLCSLLVLLLWKQKKHKNALHLIYFLLLLGAIYLAANAATMQNKWAVYFLMILFPTIPIFSLTLINRYFAQQKLPFIRKNILYICWGIAGIVVISSFVYLGIPKLTVEQLPLTKQIYYGLTLCIYVSCLVIPIVNNWRYRKTEQRSSYIIIISTHFIAFFPVIIIAILPLLLKSTYWLAPSYSLLLVFLLPLIYYYFIDTKVDHRYMLARMKYFTALTIGPALLLATFITVVFWQTNRPLWHIWFLSFIFINLALTLLLYIKEEVDQHYRPKFFKDMYRYQQSLDRISNQSAQIMNMEQLADMLQLEITSVLRVTQVQLLCIHQQQKITIIGGQTNPLLDESFLLHTIGKFEQGEVIELPFGLGIVLEKRQTDRYLLLISHKQNKARFYSEELGWLKMIANYTTIVLENLYLVQGLQAEMEAEINKQHISSTWVSRLLFALSEKERRKLAADLHDTVLQEQVLLFRKIESLTLTARLPSALMQQLVEMKQATLYITELIRETCNQLRPPLLKETGIEAAIRALVAHQQQYVDFEISYIIGSIEGQLHEEEKTALYRIVQELLHNAAKHAQAATVELQLSVQDGFIYFNYNDDGIGFNIDDVQESFQHMGLSSMKERVASLEGTITMTSQINAGLQIAIVIPAIMMEN